MLMQSVTISTRSSWMPTFSKQFLELLIPTAKAKEIDIKVSRRLRKHMGDPRFRELSERLESVRERHQQGLLLSVEFLKELLNLARDVVTAEQTLPPIDEEDRGKTALTELFQEVRNSDTPIMVERVVSDIDEIVRIVRFDGWQSTHAGEREVQECSTKDPFQVQAPPGPGTLRPSLWLHPHITTKKR